MQGQQFSPSSRETLPESRSPCLPAPGIEVIGNAHASAYVPNCVGATIAAGDDGCSATVQPLARERPHRQCRHCLRGLADRWNINRIIHARGLGTHGFTRARRCTDPAYPRDSLATSCLDTDLGNMQFRREPMVQAVHAGSGTVQVEATPN